MLRVLPHLSWDTGQIPDRDLSCERSKFYLAYKSHPQMLQNTGQNACRAICCSLGNIEPLQGTMVEPGTSATHCSPCRAGDCSHLGSGDGRLQSGSALVLGMLQ